MTSAYGTSEYPADDERPWPPRVRPVQPGYMRESAESDSAARTALADLRQLEARVDALIDAVEVLVRGLEDGPMAEPEVRRAGEAARRARELLLLAKPSRRAG